MFMFRNQKTEISWISDSLISVCLSQSSSKPQAEKREQKSPIKVVAPPKVTEEETVPIGQTEILWTDVLGQEEADETVGQVKEEPEDIMKGCLNASAVQQVKQWRLFPNLS